MPLDREAKETYELVIYTSNNLNALPPQQTDDPSVIKVTMN